MGKRFNLFSRESQVLRDFMVPGRSAVHGQNAMAATSHPFATYAAVKALHDGGNAVDGAIAAAAVLAVVEPQSTGIGGDCFALFCPKGSARVIAYNGSGRSPGAATLARYRELGLDEIATDSVHAVTLPGAIDAWCRLHGDHGSLEFARLLAPAIGYARDGYPVFARVRHDWLQAKDLLAAGQAARATFLPDNQVPGEGDIHYQPQLATTLDIIARDGSKGFYQGPVAEAMQATLGQQGGLHSMEDFAAVAGDYVDAISTNYRGYDIHQIPPNNQGLTALVMLNVLEGFDLNAYPPLSAERTHLEIEAGRLAFEMRNRHMADLSSMTVPMERLLSKQWATDLRARISVDRAMPDISDLGLQKSDTVYLSVVDRDLNAVSFINSVFHSFGSGILCPQTGVMFQNRGASFNLNADHPNCMGPGKRPMHTIMPGMMTKGDRVEMPFGVMGGDYQPFGHCRLITNMVDYGLDVQAALDMPRVFATGQEVEVETSLPAETVQGLKARGHTVRTVESPHGGGQAIHIDHTRGVLTGGSDPRKDGCALGF